MSDILKQAKAEFYKTENCSCIIIKEGKTIYQSSDKGIKPLLDVLDIMKNAVVADKIIGKAAALICAYGGAKAVYGDVMSISAQTVLNENGIEFACGQKVDNIINRQGDGICPMEKLVMDIISPYEAIKIISDKIGR